MDFYLSKNQFSKFKFPLKFNTFTLQYIVKTKRWGFVLGRDEKRENGHGPKERVRYFHKRNFILS